MEQGSSHIFIFDMALCIIFLLLIILFADFMFFEDSLNYRKQNNQLFLFAQFPSGRQVNETRNLKTH